MDFTRLEVRARRLLRRLKLKLGLLNCTEQCAYICGALTELASQEQAEVKRFYVNIGDLCQEILGIRAFVPHEHYDPIKNASFTPPEVEKAERKQVCRKTNLLIVFSANPSWGGGIEVEMAHRSGVPAVILKPRKKVSRLLLGTPALDTILEYDDYTHALKLLRRYLLAFKDSRDF